LRFRSSCRDLLAPNDFAQVDTLWRRSYQRATTFASGTPDRQETQRFLRQLVEAETGLDRRITVARAAQSAFFVSGFLLKLNADRLARDAAGAQLDPAAISEVRRYANPRQAALGALAALTEAASGELAAIDLRHLNHQASALRFAGRRVPVPAEAQAILRAARLWRRREGASDGDPLFVFRPGGGGRYTAGTPQRATAHGLQLSLRKVSAETGLTFGSLAASRRRRTADSAWMDQRGFALQSLS
jgi:integrase